tara:strand:+ start:1399 stop:1698 length:300 start_codon:yes stop_codon:yes gene_type:complete
MSRIKSSIYITIVRRLDMIIVDLGYRKIILTKERALALVECLESAEIYEDKYWPEAKRKEKGITTEYTYHVYPNEASFSMRILGDTHYQMAKLAGKPQE